MFSGVDLTAVDFNGSTELEFDTLGAPFDTSGAALTTGTVTFSDGTSITVHPETGYVEITR